MILKKYIEVENVYASIYRDEAKIINAINKILLRFQARNGRFSDCY